MSNDCIFNFHEPIFSNLLEQSLQQKYENFSFDFLSDWIYSTYLGEYETTIAYPKILDNFQTNFYNQQICLNEEERCQVAKYLNRMIEDENEHTFLLQQFLKQNFNKDVAYNTIEEIEKNTITLVDNTNLSDLLVRYYVGECYLWTSFYLIYRNIENIKLKNLFHQLVVDESHHNNNIYKIYKKLKNQIKFDQDHYLTEVTNLRYFGLKFVKNQFNLGDENSKKSQWWLKLIYNHQWQQKFNLIFLKKTYKLYELFYSDSNFDNYTKIINKNESSWNLSITC